MDALCRYCYVIVQVDNQRNVTAPFSFQAYQQGITGKGYVWLLIGWYNDKWWAKDDPKVKCNRTEMREAVRGYISMESLQLGDPSVVTVANIVSTLVITSQLEIQPVHAI